MWHQTQKSDISINMMKQWEETFIAKSLGKIYIHNIHVLVDGDTPQ